MSKNYFSKLNYSLANEDTALEYQLVQQLKPKRTLAVCGSGGRSIPLLVGTTSELVCVDLSLQQLLLAKHRSATFEELSHQEFLQYWGFAPYGVSEHVSQRQTLYKRLNLDTETRAYFDELYSKVNWHGLIYEGKWERTFTGVPKFVRKLVGSRYDEIFEFTNMTEQRAYFDRNLKKFPWRVVPRLVLKIFGNAAFFNAFLYKGHFVQKNTEGSHFDYYRNAYTNMFYQDLCRKNFFLQLSFLGYLKFQEGNTIEAHLDVFNEIKTALGRTKITYQHANLIELANKDTEKFDFVSLSDVPSYFSDQLAENYLQQMTPGLNPGALVVVRCYLRTPENTNFKGFKDVTPRFKHLIDQEKTQIYITFIYEFLG